MLPLKLTITVYPLRWGRLLVVSPLVGFFLHWATTWPWDSPNAAGWVQAVGAIIAIGGAAVFPYWHEAAKDRARRERLRLLMQTLATQQHDLLGRLYSVVNEAVHDFGQFSIGDYLKNNEHLEWPPLIEALQVVPIAEIEPYQVMILGELKVSAAVATDICARLRDGRWNVIGDFEIDAVHRLKYYVQWTDNIRIDLAGSVLASKSYA